MIEFLSDSSVLNPQIDFLLTLQTLRIEHFEFLNKAFLSVTILGELWLPVLIGSIVYWCIDTKSGIYLFMLFSLQMFASQTLKMLACVYRPWVLSSSIHPVPEAVPAARGYSFPSGHTGTAASVLGGLAYYYKHRRIFAFILVLLVLCTGFSRMWLGVHTPQDVAGGLLIGLVLITALKPAIDAAEKNKDIYLYILAAVDILSAAALMFICYIQKYPLDYVNGQLLVNPHNSVYSAVNCFGFAAGIINGAVLCRRYTNFDAAAGSVKERAARGAIGVLLAFIIIKSVSEYAFSNALNFLHAFLIMGLTGFFITFIYPAVICIVNNLKNRKN